MLFSFTYSFDIKQTELKRELASFCFSSIPLLHSLSLSLSIYLSISLCHLSLSLSLSSLILFFFNFRYVENASYSSMTEVDMAGGAAGHDLTGSGAGQDVTGGLLDASTILKDEEQQEEEEEQVGYCIYYNYHLYDLQGVKIIARLGSLWE